MITVAATFGLDDLVKDFGGRSENVLRGPSIELLREPKHDRYISLAEYAGLLETASREANNPSFGFVFGHRFDMRRFGPVGYATGFSRTLGDALNYFCDNFDCIQEDSELAMTISGDACIISYEINGDQDFNAAQDAETTIGLILGFCKRSVGKDWCCERILFKHGIESDDGLKTEISGISPAYQQKYNALAFPKTLLQSPIKTFDPLLLNLVKNAVRDSTKQKKLSMSTADEVYRTVWYLIETDRATDLEYVANEMGMTPRTLQLRMASIGETFRQVRSKAVLDRASELLSTSRMTITDIALLLGFSEASAFSRAFSARFDVSPAAYRRNSECD